MKNLQPTQSNSYRSFLRSVPMLLLLISICICFFGACNCSSSCPNPPENPEKEPEPEQDKRLDEALIFIGISAEGKSTLCNSIFEKVVFESGLRTTKVQEHTYAGKLYIDTPGLDSVNVDDASTAGQIAALRKAMNDVATKAKGFKLIICLPPDVNHSQLKKFIQQLHFASPSIEYGIIFNKLSPAFLQKVVNNDPAYQALKNCLDGLSKPPQEKIFLKRIDELIDEENKYFDSASENRQKLVAFLDNLKVNKVE